MKRLIIIGAGGHGKVCAEIAQDLSKWDEICFLDDRFPEIKKSLTFNIIGSTDDIDKFRKFDFFVGIGDNKVRSNYIKLLIEKRLNLITLIHPTAFVSKYVEIGVGTSIHHFSVINTDTKIGRGCIINTSSIIEHENIINSYAHISPNVTLGGKVEIGNYCWIGLGTSVINNTYIVENTTIGAGSLVLKSQYKKGVLFGVVK